MHWRTRHVLHFCRALQAQSRNFDKEITDRTTTVKRPETARTTRAAPVEKINPTQGPVRLGHFETLCSALCHAL